MVKPSYCSYSTFTPLQTLYSGQDKLGKGRLSALIFLPGLCKEKGSWWESIQREAERWLWVRELVTKPDDPNSIPRARGPIPDSLRLSPSPRFPCIPQKRDKEEHVKYLNQLPNKIKYAFPIWQMGDVATGFKSQCFSITQNLVPCI